MSGLDIQQFGHCIEAAAIAGVSEPAQIVKNAEMIYINQKRYSELPVVVENDGDHTVLFGAFLKAAAHIVGSHPDELGNADGNPFSVMSLCEEIEAEAVRQHALQYAPGR